jgi:hypothetical protein
MAISSKINIDVDSAEFLALKAAFDKYETALKRMPVARQNMGRASSATKTNFESVAANMKVVGGSLAAITTSAEACAGERSETRAATCAAESGSGGEAPRARMRGFIRKPLITSARIRG